MADFNVWLVVILSLFGVWLTGVADGKNVDVTLSRRKRYLTFPEGASLSIAICMTVQTGLLPGQIFTEGINWGISYELPNDTKDFKEFDDLFKRPKKEVQRRYRRDLYLKMETVMSSMGYNGRSCILRALCEGARQLRPRGESLVDEILRIVFSYPEETSPTGGDALSHYDAASQKSFHINDECHELFPGCPFSLIDLALGYYSSYAHLPDLFPHQH